MLRGNLSGGSGRLETELGGNQPISIARGAQNYNYGILETDLFGDGPLHGVGLRRRAEPCNTSGLSRQGLQIQHGQRHVQQGFQTHQGFHISAYTYPYHTCSFVWR